ncbi:methyltransferase domain-containing protein [Streptomyces genisteinicus]|uniref:Protein-L-isoaspartate O-methyltransferase n=1 Tax=Streptomyces genisteinicus TaxID=2768068 RepID=A0A7H0I4W8_9ACTN|nr:methyltransferase domain-containing protein [Streptomyces genisteinicus]QNP67834.1 methyltransferase domain-containing protein [Streptomyces genisteinicus]
MRGAWEPVTWGDPGYLDDVYSDAALTTQLDEHGVPTSSSSQPSLMLTMLEALDVRDGQRVYELGAGTGYNAALLSHRLGDSRVTTVDIDSGLVEAAVRHLHSTGYRPTAIVGDGARGYLHNAPYDRIIATAALPMIPPPLLDQATEGAVVVAPLGYGIVRATVTGPGRAAGRFLGTPAYFMLRRAPGNPPQFESAREQQPSDTHVPVGDVLGRLRFPLSIALPGFTSCSWRDDHGRLDAVGLWTPDGSTAVARTTGTVQQTGPRLLWDTVEELADALPGDPDRADFHLEVTPAGQRVTHRPSGLGWELPTLP